MQQDLAEGQTAYPAAAPAPAPAPIPTPQPRAEPVPEARREVVPELRHEAAPPQELREPPLQRYVAPPEPASQPAPQPDFEAMVRARLAAQPTAPPRPRTCLIVDDSRVVRRVSRGIVEGLGYTVIEAENGEEALARCKADMPDLILLDWDMPVMTGIEFITNLRALPAAAHAKAVFCTSKGETLDIYKGIEAGADEYVTKPFDEASLLTKLQRIGAA